MSAFKAIRERLGLTQQEMAEGLGCSQGNVSLLDKGQTVMPDMAERLIELAARKGLKLCMDHVYGRKALPAPRGGGTNNHPMAKAA